MRYICVQLYAYVTDTYVYESHMSNLTHVQTLRNLHILENYIEKSMHWDCVDQHCLPLYPISF